MNHPTLVLFDIDGTILTSGGAGEHALRLGFKEAFGLDEDLKQVDIAGRTDSGIARQILAKHGLQATPEMLERFFSGYLRNLESELPRRQGRLLPGVLPLIQRLQSLPNAHLALLTGNLERGARLKLSHYGLADVFDFGAFADDHHDRNQLGPFAKKRARDRSGISFEEEHTFIIGDTPHDISCARACGAKAVAVATGSFLHEQLAGHEPDVLFADLSDTNAVLAALGHQN